MKERMNNQELKLRFDERWKRLEKKSKERALELPDKKALWRIVKGSWENGFICEYCSKHMVIRDSKKPPISTFSLDHKTSLDLGGDNSIDNFAIVCFQCNIIKGTLRSSTYKKLLQSLWYDQELLDRIFTEIWDGQFANKLRREAKRT